MLIGGQFMSIRPWGSEMEFEAQLWPSASDNTLLRPGLVEPAAAGRARDQ